MKEKVLFDGFEVDYKGEEIISVKFNNNFLHFDVRSMYCPPHNLIEDLIPYGLKLTPPALKQIGL